MNQRYRIIPNYTKNGLITVNSENVGKTVMKDGKIVYIRFGIKCCEVKVAISDEIEKDEVLLSSDVVEDLKIPRFLSYEIAFDKNSVIFGPYIGILTEKKEEKLRQVVYNLKSYVYGYKQIGGAILAFSEEGVDMDSHLIRGFIFNPENGKWEEGTYPYPASIFKRTGIRKKVRNHFQSLLGDAIFNSYVFNKWEAYQYLNCFETIRQYLPDTVLYNGPADVKKFLKDYKLAYIKPIYGSRGKSILKLDAKGKWFILHFNKSGKNQEQCFKTTGELNEFLKSNLKAQGCVIQKSLNLISKENRKIDFRLILVKDGNGQWNDVGLIARHGVKDSIVSNVSAGGSAQMADITFKNVMHLSDEEASNLRNKMSSIGKEVALALEKSGISCGNLGIDMAIDMDSHIWIIEINNINPNHLIARRAGDRQMFYRARLLNMLYAKRLAGF